MRRTPNKLIDVLDRIHWNRVIIYHSVSAIPLVFIQCVVDSLLLGFYIDNTFQFELNFWIILYSLSFSLTIYWQEKWSFLFILLKIDIRIDKIINCFSFMLAYYLFGSNSMKSFQNYIYPNHKTHLFTSNSLDYSSKQSHNVCYCFHVAFIKAYSLSHNQQAFFCYGFDWLLFHFNGVSFITVLIGLFKKKQFLICMYPG